MKKLGIDGVIYSSGILLNSALGLVFFVWIARALGPEYFGIISVIIAISVVASDVFDFGMNTSMLKFLSEANEVKKKELSRDFLSYKIFSSIFVCIIGLIISPTLTYFLFKSGSDTFLLWQGFLAAGGLIIYGYVNSNLQARKRFVSSVVLNLLSNGLRLVAAAYFFIIGGLNINTAMFSYLVPIFLTTVCWGIFDSDVTLRPLFSKRVLLPVVNYAKWVAGSMAVSSISSRLDNVLLVNLANTFQTGIYTSVQRIFLAFNQIPAGISMVMVPDLSSNNGRRIGRAFRFGLISSALLSVGLFGFILIAPWLVIYIFGSAFALSVLPSQILALGAIFFIMSTPFNSYILYTKAKSNRILVITLIQLLFTVIFNLILIPVFQADGAAISYTVTCFIALTVSVIFYYRD